jgi:hypothetical protein
MIITKAMIYKVTMKLHPYWNDCLAKFYRVTSDIETNAYEFEMILNGSL